MPPPPQMDRLRYGRQLMTGALLGPAPGLGVVDTTRRRSRSWIWRGL